MKHESDELQACAWLWIPIKNQLKTLTVTIS